MRATIVAVLAVFAVVTAMGCGEHVAAREPVQVPSRPPPAAVAPLAAPDAALVAPPATVTAVTAPPPEAPPAPIAKPGYDFIADIQVLYRVVACGQPGAPIPEL